MKRLRLTLTFLLLFCQTVLADGQNRLTGEVGSNIVLPCYEFPSNTTPVQTQWIKNNLVVATRNHSLPTSKSHYSVLDNGSLNITGLLTIDEGVYRCQAEPSSSSGSQQILLTLTGGSSTVNIEVIPATRLPNGTLFVSRSADVLFNCTSTSYPSQNLSWTFQGAALNESVEGFATGSDVNFKIMRILPVDQGIYTCKAQDLISTNVTTRSVELLIYYASEKHPDCFWHASTKPDQIFFNCSWTGNYPTPVLHVFLNPKSSESSFTRSLETENFELTLNRSMLYEGQNITCIGEHITKRAGEEKICTLTLKAPSPEVTPMLAALQGTNISIMCSELVSLPPAVTAWYRDLNGSAIAPSPKYILNEEGPYQILTIVSVSKEDEGLYICKSENVLAARAVEVYLTVRTSVSSGVAFGVFLSLLIVLAGVTVGYLLYSRRDRICLGLTFSSPDDRVDVMSLIDSEEDEIFHDAVPRLPPVLNGNGSTNATTLVEIHHIHASDHEDNVNDTESSCTQDQTQMEEEH